MNTVFSQYTLEKQDPEADALAYRCCQRRAGNSEVQTENKDWVQNIFKIPPVVIPIME